MPDDQPVDIDPRGVDGGGRQFARRHDLFHLHHRNAPGGGHQRVEILRGVAIDHVAVPVGFPAFDQREIAADRLFKDVVSAVELAHLFAFGDRGAIPGGGVKAGDASAAGADFFRQRSLRGEFYRQLAAEHQLFKQRVFPDVRGHHLADLARLQQHAETETVDPAVVGDHRQPLHLATLHLGDQVLGNAAQAEAAGEQRHAVR